MSEREDQIVAVCKAAFAKGYKVTTELAITCVDALAPWLVKAEPQKQSKAFRIETMKSDSSHYKHFSDVESHIHAIEIADAIFELAVIKEVRVVRDNTIDIKQPDELVYLKRKVE